MLNFLLLSTKSDNQYTLLHGAMPTSLKAENIGTFISKKYWDLKQIVKDNLHANIRATFFQELPENFYL